MSNVSWRIPALRPQSHARPARAAQCLCDVSRRQRNVAFNPSRAALFAQRPRCIVARCQPRLPHACLHAAPSHSLFCCAVESPSLCPLTAASRDFPARFYAVRSVAQSYPPLTPRLPHSCPSLCPIFMQISALSPHHRRQLRFFRTHPPHLIHRLRRVVALSSAFSHSTCPEPP